MRHHKGCDRPALSSPLESSRQQHKPNTLLFRDLCFADAHSFHESPHVIINRGRPSSHGDIE
jgi:hypothetical protein